MIKNFITAGPELSHKMHLWGISQGSLLGHALIHGLTTLKCLSIGTPNTTTFPLVPNRKWWLLGVPVFEHIIIRL